jgi:hypothetical protein
VYIGQDSGAPVNRKSSSLPPFQYEAGYFLNISDLGGAGIKLELSHNGDVGAAVMLPPETVQELGRWLLRTLGQDEHGFPVELGGILERLSKAKKTNPILQRGDKTRIREALRALKTESLSHMATGG